MGHGSHPWEVNLCGLGPDLSLFHFAPNEVLLQSLGIACGATTTPGISRALGGDWLV